MPLGFEPSIAQGMAAMGERYGDRLVNQLAQAGSTIENGLKAVTTMKELQSLGQNLSQLSPESPDYQQQLVQLGAAHPFAMQDPRGQALINMGNQAHLQWQHQQYAIQAADRAAGRAEAHDNRMYDRAVTLAGMRQKQGDEMVDFNNIGLGKRRLSPTPDFGQDINVPASLNQAPMEMGAAPEAAAVEAISDQPMKIGLGGRIRNPGLSEGDDGFDYATGLSGTVVPKSKMPAEDSAEGQEEPDELAVEMRNLAMAQGGSIAKKDLARNAAIASANVRARHAAKAKGATGSGFGYKSKDEAISDFGGKPIGGGLYETDDGTVLTVTQSASGKWHWKTPPEDHSAMPEFDENGNARLGNTILERDDNGTIRKVGTIPQAKPMAEGKLSELQQSALRSAVSARDKSESAYSNLKGEYDAAVARGDKVKDVAAAQAKMSNAAKVYRIAAERHDELVKSFKSSSSSSAPKRLTAEVKDRLIKLANGDLKKAAEMARKEGYIP